jgi:hypothetical protein
VGRDGRSEIYTRADIIIGGIAGWLAEQFMKSDIAHSLKSDYMAEQRLVPLRVKTSRQTMSAMAAAFAGSGHGGPILEIAPPEQRHEHTTTIHGRRPNDPRQHARQRRVVARRVVLAVPPPDDHSADPWPDHVSVPSFGPRMVCTRCGIIGADARPNWQEQPQRHRAGKHAAPQARARLGGARRPNAWVGLLRRLA